MAKRRKSTLTSGERAYLGGIGGGRAIRTATRRHDSPTYQAAPVTLPRLAFLECEEDSEPMTEAPACSST